MNRFDGLLKLRFAQESADWIVIRMRVGAQTRTAAFRRLSALLPGLKRSSSCEGACEQGICWQSV